MDGIFEAAEESFSNQQREIEKWKGAWIDLRTQVEIWHSDGYGFPSFRFLTKMQELAKKYGLK